MSQRVVRHVPSGWIGLACGLVVAAFLLSRLAFLDSDLPDFRLSEYSPIDEFAYAVPAFNLLHYGTWTHQLAPWAPVEGLPMNALQNVVAAATMAIAGSTYWGLRLSSVLFALLAFLVTWRLLWTAARDAIDDGVASGRAGLLAVAIGVSILLVDFGSIVSARGVEPTISRIAAVAAIIWAVERGWFLARGQSLARAAAFGVAVAAAVWFVYIYNLFLVPGAFVALLLCVHERGRIRRTVAQAIAFGAGAVVGTAAYFGAVAVIYGQSPIDWYHAWIAPYGNSTRLSGVSWANVTSLIDANLFRFDWPLLVLFLLGLPVFVWWSARSRRAWAILLVCLLAVFTVQSAAVADYPYKKFMLLAVFVLPVGVTAALRGHEFLTWLRTSRARLATAAVYAIVVLVACGMHLLSTRLGAPMTLVVKVAGAAAAVLATILIVAPRPIRGPLAVVLAATLVLPLAYLDWRTIYRAPTFTYRDALIAVGATIDGQVTAGDLSFAMQLYNTSRPVLEGYTYGISPADYTADVVRAFAEGRATWLFSYTRPGIQKKWADRGFVLVETYAIKLPNGWLMGRYRFAGAP